MSSSRKPLALLTATAAAGLLAVAPAGQAYPAKTCGKTSVNGKKVLVKTHGPTCGFALKSVRTFISSHHAPKGYTCKAYPPAEPALCQLKKHPRKTYFTGLKA